VLDKHKSPRQKEINTFILQVNDFVGQTLKFKTTITPSHLNHIKERAKEIGIKFQSHELDARFINSKDFVSVMKKVYCMLNTKILAPHRRTLVLKDQDLNQPRYKFWVECNGNNHNIVKGILKRRSWLNWVDINPEAMWAGNGP
jgi:hypothetical protein